MKPPHAKGGREAGPSQRQLRAGELVRHALAEILRAETLQDPALTDASVTVTEVRMSPDLRHAICFVEPLGAAFVGSEVKGDVAAVSPDEVVNGLNRVTKFLRGRLSRQIELKFTPDLKFLHDGTFAEAERMNRLFERPEVRRDLQNPSSSVNEPEARPNRGPSSSSVSAAGSSGFRFAPPEDDDKNQDDA